ncbi:MAG TPA: SAM-dependent methyltransferase [Chlamydiales bacterium]|nr:SAM-dependent methyltransferase [Chlamydiales bacterium]
MKNTTPFSRIDFRRFEPAQLQPILEGQTWGLLTDAGLPCIADPGSDLVAAARYFSIEVQGIPGPCSFLLALQLSGFSGQRFSSHGYLPRDAEELTQKVKELEARSQRGETQIWIETPYRSAKMLEFLKNALLPKTLLCVAANLTTLRQKIGSYPVYQWKSFSFELGKEPSVFLTAKRPSTNFGFVEFLDYFGRFLVLFAGVVYEV